jgi:mono/diheme cytochrome c family protein
MMGLTEKKCLRVGVATAGLVAAVAATVWAAGALRPAPAQAIPMFALRTGASCELCHTVFPGMTNYGMMVMMSDFAMLPHDAAHSPGIASIVFAEEYDSNPDAGIPKLHTDNLGFLSGGFIANNFTYYVEQHVVDGGLIGGTDQAWLSYNRLFGDTGFLQIGKFHTPFPFMPAHRITIAPYATTANTIGENDFNEDDSHWGVTLSQMRGTLMYSVSALGGNDLIGPGALQLAGDHSHSVDATVATMSDQPFNFGVGLVRGFAPLAEGGFDAFNRSALYLQYIAPGDQRLQIQAVGQLGYDNNPFGTGQDAHTRGMFVEGQYRLPRGNYAVLRWDSQTGDSPVAGVTLDLIHQFLPNMKLTVEGRKLTTGTTMGLAFEWVGPWQRKDVLASPRLGSMPGMNMAGMNMAGMSMASMSMDGMSALDHTLAHGDAALGATAFQLHNCVQCHGVGGIGGSIGPRLIGVANSLTPSQMYDFIKHPRPPMPDFKLDDTEIANLVAYVDSLTPGHTVMADVMRQHPNAMAGMMPESMGMPPPTYAPDQAPVALGPHGFFAGIELGDPIAGAKLFAANCARCHGAGGSGGFGPKLIGLGDRYAPSFFAWRIKDPTPPMPKLRLSDRQIADLAAYIETMGTQRAAPGKPRR